MTNNYNDLPCLASMQLFGDGWTLRIVGALADGELRFSQLQRAVTISPVTLTDRLKKLEAHQIVVRQCETKDRLSVAYKLTPKGVDMLPVLAQIKQYSCKYFDPGTQKLPQ